MLKRILVSITLFISLFIVAQTPVEKNGQLQIEGTQLLNQHKQPVQLRGMSLFWSQWIGKYYNKEVVNWLKNDWNCSVVRAALAVEHEGYLEFPERELKKIETVIDAAIAEGIYVIVDWHDHHGENHLEEAKTFFTHIAKKYGQHPNIIYELYNEPLDISWDVLKPHHEAIIKEIRKFDSKNLIVCGTRNWAQEVQEVIGKEIEDPNVTYTIHYYAATHKAELRAKAQQALDAGVPLFVTEHGITQADGDTEINEEEAEIWWDFLEKNGISWCTWSIADKDELSAALKPGANSKGNWSKKELSKGGKIVRKKLRSY